MTPKKPAGAIAIVEFVVVYISRDVPSGVIFSSEIPFLRPRKSPRLAAERLAGSGGGLLQCSNADLQLKLPQVSTATHTAISSTSHTARGRTKSTNAHNNICSRNFTKFLLYSFP